jgi:hypothetical protein
MGRKSRARSHSASTQSEKCSSINGHTHPTTRWITAACTVPIGKDHCAGYRQAAAAHNRKSARRCASHSTWWPKDKVPGTASALFDNRPVLVRIHCNVSARVAIELIARRSVLTARVIVDRRPVEQEFAACTAQLMTWFEAYTCAVTAVQARITQATSPTSRVLRGYRRCRIPSAPRALRSRVRCLRIAVVANGSSRARVCRPFL